MAAKLIAVRMNITSVRRALQMSMEGNERDQLLVERAPMVSAIARSIHGHLPRFVEVDDLIAAGHIGLIEAYDKFDGARNVNFNTSATFCIRGAIIDSLRDLDWGPRTLRGKARLIEEAVLLLTAEHGHAPSEPEIARAVGMSLEGLRRLKGELKGLDVGSLYAVQARDAEEEELEHVPDPGAPDPFFCCLGNEIRRCLAQAIENLPERERAVISLCYYEGMTLAQAGQVLGLTESRISQIRSSAVVHLRAGLRQLVAPQRLRPAAR